MSRFAKSRRAAALIAALYALWAIPLIFSLFRRAYVQWVISHPAGIEEVRRVCRLDADNAECAVRLAIIAEQSGATSIELWTKAVEFNPLDSFVLIQAALAHESAGGTVEAERLLIKAARLSRTWLPRWSLTNYYHRRGRPDDVARWARLSLERGYGDRVPLYSLCLSTGLTYSEILDKVLPASHKPSLETYMAFLRSQPASEDSLAALTSASLRLEQSGAGEPLPGSSADQLVLAADFLIRSRRPEQAHKIWAGMRRQGLLPGEYGPAEGELSDARFAAEPLAAPAFGWRMAQDEGVEIHAGTPAGGVKIELSGRQPETFMVLSQCIRLTGARRWRLGYEASGAGDQPVGRHFRWIVSKLGPDKEIAVSALDGLGGEQWSEARMQWQSPPEGGFYRLGLVYARPPGSSRLTGELRMRALRLDSEEIRP